MKNTVIRFGLIAGSISAAFMFATVPLWSGDLLDHKYGELVGYSGMVIALSFVFMGVKSYRDKLPGGAITFWQGLKVGLMISLIAAVMYALAWEVCYNTVAGNFMEEWYGRHFAQMKEDGATELEIAKAKEEAAAFGEMYKNPIIRFGVSLTEILPVGILISLVSAALLRRKTFLPSAKSA